MYESCLQGFCVMHFYPDCSMVFVMDDYVGIKPWDGTDNGFHGYKRMQ